MPGGSSPSAASTSSRLDDAPSHVGDYKLLNELGPGRCGSIYLARQVSSGRQVALELVRATNSRDAAQIAAIAKTAHVATELDHPNLVRVLDYGGNGGLHFVVTELVEGEPVDELRRRGPLDARVATSLVLQAARGLSAAHTVGLSHDRLEPGDLLLDSEGLVKVAGVGIGPGKTTPPTSSQESEPLPWKKSDDTASAHKEAIESKLESTTASIKTSTARPDENADLRGLGNTLASLIDGSAVPSTVPPTIGSAERPLREHWALPPRLEDVNGQAAQIAERATSADRPDRFLTVSEFVTASANLLGVDTAGPFTPDKQRIERLRDAAFVFNDALAAQIRSKLTQGLWFLTLIGIIAGALAGNWIFVIAVLTLGIAAGACSLVISAAIRQDEFARYLRRFAWSLSWRHWAGLLVLLLGAAAVLLWLDWFLVWLTLVAIGCIIPLAMHFRLTRRAAAERGLALRVLRELVRELRLAGIEEYSLRHFICKYSGRDWEELYETLFGYEAKLAARERWGKDLEGRRRPRFAAWRDPLMHVMSRRLALVETVRRRKYVRQVEEDSLLLQGVSQADARRRAIALVRELFPDEAAPATASTAPKRDYADGRWRAASRFDRIFHANLRFFTGAALIATCVFWLYQNERIPTQEIRQATTEAIETKDPGALAKLRNLEIDTSEMQPLTIPYVPSAVSAPLGNFYAGTAGLILVVSIFFHSLLITIPLTIIAPLVFAAQWL